MYDWRKQARDPLETIYIWPIANEEGGKTFTYKFWNNTVKARHKSNAFTARIVKK